VGCLPGTCRLPGQSGVVGRSIKNNYFTEMRSGSEEGSYLRHIYFLYHSTLGLRVIKKKKKKKKVDAQRCWDRSSGRRSSGWGQVMGEG